MAHNRNARVARSVRRGAAAALAAVLAGLGQLVPGTARADDRASSLDVSAVISGDGSLRVT